MHHRGRAALAVAVLLGVVLPGVAHADPMADARRWYQKGRCREALRALAAAERNPALEEDLRVEVYGMQATCLVALQKTAERDEALDRLVRLRPLHELDAALTPPDVRAALASRRAAWQQREGVTVESVTLAPPAVNVTLRGQLTRANTVELFLRPTGSGAFTRVSAAVKQHVLQVGVTDTALWEAAGRAGGMEWVAEVWDASRVPVARLGDAVHPPVATVTAQMVAPPEPVAPPAPEPPPPPTRPKRTFRPVTEKPRAEPEGDGAPLMAAGGSGLALGSVALVLAGALALAGVAVVVVPVLVAVPTPLLPNSVKSALFLTGGTVLGTAAVVAVLVSVVLVVAGAVGLGVGVWRR